MPEKPTYEELEKRVQRLEQAELERRRAEQKLFKSEARLKESQRLAQIGSWELDLLNNELIWTDEVYRIFEIDPGKFGASYKAFLDACHPDDRKAVDMVYAGSLKYRKPYDIDHRLLFPDGRVKYVQERCETYFDNNGEPVRSIGTVMDITEQKQAEEALKKAHDQFVMVMDSIDALVHIVDIKTCEVLFVNRHVRTILGDNVVGKKCWKSIQKNMDGPCSFCNRERLIDSEGNPGDVCQWEYQSSVNARWYYCYDRAIRWIDGRIVRLEIATDITPLKIAEAEREKLNAQLDQARKLESVGQLAGGIAHDYNNMLNVILGYTEIALEKTYGNNGLREDLEEIFDAARRSADITRQLLAFARQQTIDPRGIDLNEMVEGMLNMLRRLIGEEIDFSWKPGTGRISVFIDPSQLDQILANLCVNARDAIDGVGKITIETGNVCFDQEYCDFHAGFIPGKFVMLAVSDDGRGMDKDAQNRIFEPFFSTKDVGGGTGLGLATVYGIVKQNDGFINVYSEKGEGTTFRIYLPVYDADVDGSEISGEKGGALAGDETIIIVEDEIPILKLAKTILERFGYEVITAATPAKALGLAGEYDGEISLLMTDVVMPEMNGRKLADKLLVLYPDLKVLFMSGYTSDVIVNRGVLDNGMNFIQKPFSINSLAAKVREVLNGITGG